MREEQKLTRIADELRLDVMEMVYSAKDGHPGPAFSCADIITALYFQVMNIYPDAPQHPLRDRFILSKGHGCTVLYAALAKCGFFDKSHLDTLRNYGSILQGHPVMGKTPGVDMTSGSLGNGISIGLGMALGLRYQNNLTSRVFVVVGDGELQEGIVWETLLAGATMKTSNLVVFVDANHFQSGGTVDQISSIYPLENKLSAFGWFVQTIDGHDMTAILAAIACAGAQKEKPSIIVCNTVKGKGLPFMENDNSWHKRVPTTEEMVIARKELGGSQA